MARVVLLRSLPLAVAAGERHTSRRLARVSTSPDAGRNAVIGGVLVGLGLVALVRLVGPLRLIGIAAIVAGAFHLNRTDPKRLTAVLVVLVVGLGVLAYLYARNA